MPNINIPISDELLRCINIAAIRAHLTQKAWVVDALSQAATEHTGRAFVSHQWVELAGFTNAELTKIGTHLSDACPSTASHDPKTCRVYKCGRCAALKT